MHCCIAHEMKKCVRYILNSKFKFNVIQYLLFVTVHLKLGKIRAGYWLLLFGLKQFFLQEKKNKGSTYYFSLFTFFFFFLTSLAQLVKNPPANAGDERDEGSIPEKGRSPGEGNGNPVQYSYLEYPMDYIPPGPSIHRIFQARVREWVTISFSRGSSLPRDRTRVSRIGGRRFNLWAIREAPIIMTM